MLIIESQAIRFTKEPARLENKYRLKNIQESMPQLRRGSSRMQLCAEAMQCEKEQKRASLLTLLMELGEQILQQALAFLTLLHELPEHSHE